jgi:hypothetical protein
MKTKYIAAALGIGLLFLGACEEETSPLPPPPQTQPQPLPLTVEADAAIQAAIEDLLRANPEVYYTPPRNIPGGNVSPPGGSTGYSIQVVQPDPSIDYSILRVEPDPNRHYSMMIIDPKTQKPPAHLDPNELKAIIDEIEKRRQESEEK